MPPRLKRALWVSFVTCLVATGILVACWLSPARIPPQWIKPQRFTAEFATESYLVKDSQHVNYLQFDMMCEARGEEFESSTVITAKFTDRAYLSDNNAGSITGDRAAALARIRNAFPNLCNSAGYPSMHSRYDELIAAGTTGITIDYPERRFTAVFMAARRYVVYAATAALIVAVPLTLYFLYTLIKARRAARANGCPRCGYSLTGLAPSTLCPECGLDITADRGRSRWRHGTTRCIAGASLLVIGLGLSAVWFNSATTPSAEATRLLNRDSASGLESHSAWLNRGGLHLQKLATTRPFALRSISISGAVGGPQDPDDLSGLAPPYGYQPTTPPIDWAPWHYDNQAGMLSFTTLWISLWPPALIILIAGGTLLAAGCRARRQTRSSNPAK